MPPHRRILTAEQAARFSRQIMLSEVGAAGQAAIVGATARVGGSAVAERYARGAGFGAVVDGDLDIDALAPEQVVRTRAARELLAGARAVLGEVRRTLEEVPP